MLSDDDRRISYYTCSLCGIRIRKHEMQITGWDLKNKEVSEIPAKTVIFRKFEAT